ncbi:Il20 [Lemmus lemmus]
MKGFSFAFGLFSAVGFLLWTPVTGLKTLHLGSCVITANLQAIQKDFSEIHDSVHSERCCLLRHLVRFYLDQVFKFYQNPDHHILRKTSSLANSFLIIKKDLSICVSRAWVHSLNHVATKLCFPILSTG